VLPSWELKEFKNATGRERERGGGGGERERDNKAKRRRESGYHATEVMKKGRVRDTEEMKRRKV